MHREIISMIVVHVVIIISSIGVGRAGPVVEYDKGFRYEEYIVEHEISEAQARNSALNIDLKTVRPPAGCQTCSKTEMVYCLGRDLISDHCCCDKRYREELTFIPHTCYMGTQICQPIVGDCDEYTRLRTCCCEQYALEKWKKRSSGMSYLNNHFINSKSAIIILVLAYFVQYFVY